MVLCNVYKQEIIYDTTDFEVQQAGDPDRGHLIWDRECVWSGVMHRDTTT